MGRLKVVDAQGQPQLLVVLGEFDAIFGEKRPGRSFLPSFPVVERYCRSRLPQDGHSHHRIWENE